MTWLTACLVTPRSEGRSCLGPPVVSIPARMNAPFLGRSSIPMECSCARMAVAYAPRAARIRVGVANSMGPGSSMPGTISTSYLIVKELDEQQARETRAAAEPGPSQKAPLLVGNLQVALGQFLDVHVLEGDHADILNEPRGPVHVPDPGVLHGHLEENLTVIGCPHVELD